MAKKQQTQTPFGKLCDDLKRTYRQVAKELKVTAPFVSMLAHGKATPGLAQALLIDDWAKKSGRRCPPESWREALGLGA